MAEIKYVFEPMRNMSKSENILRPLCDEYSESYFLSWGWYENLLATLPENLPVSLLYVSENGEPTCGFLLGSASIIKTCLIYRKTNYVNATGNPIYDALTIEYNSILKKNHYHIDLLDLTESVANNWDEFVMPGLDARLFPASALSEETLPYQIIHDYQCPSYYVDLESVRNNDLNYLDLLSKGMRKEIRRTYRASEKIGAIKIEGAKNKDQAIDIFNELAKLHQLSWQKRGKPGAFACQWFRDFHARLISNRFSFGEIQLIRVSVGSITLGCRYNFVFKGTVYGYQTGLNYEIGQDIKPGYISATEAIMYNAKEGNTKYDFLGGSPDQGSLKARLSTNHNVLQWIRLQKKRARFAVEKKVRKLFNK